MKWKISKLDIKAFKAFENSYFDFETSCLVTLDGPNGYGKTTIFDALELLLTGNIERVRRLYVSIMGKKKSNFKDNLYWNANSGGDLSITAEFTNEESGGKLIISRMARAVDLKVPKKNSAENFELFKLYELSSFDSKDFSKEITNDDLEKILGRGLINNYSLLNYLEQGQSAFLFSKNMEGRKGALSELINSQWLIDHLKKCKNWEAHIQSKHLSPVITNKINDLQNRIAKYNQQIGGDSKHSEFEKITTKVPEVPWDKVSPFDEADPDVYTLFYNELILLKHLVENKSEVKSRIKNNSIEKTINEKKLILEMAVSIGNFIDDFDSLAQKKITIDSTFVKIKCLDKDYIDITISDLELIFNPEGVPSNVAEIIENRDRLKVNSSGKTIAISELENIKKNLLETFKRIHELSGSCPLCGHDWPTQAALLDAIELEKKNISKELGNIGLALQNVLASLRAILDPIALVNRTSFEALSNSFPIKLFNSLNNHREHFVAIKSTIEGLSKIGVACSFEFTDDANEIQMRSDGLVALIRATKAPEAGELPPDWYSFMTKVFSAIDDFYILDVAQIDSKINYINFKYNESKVSALAKLNLEFNQLQAERKAAISLKEKIVSLRNSLTELEKSYSAQMLSEIELIFHLYSGRLIQNYQRGLGLFIEHGEGKELRFSTATRSEHDALLSMSSGQISALSLAFFFSLNKVYSSNSLILIDDPAQSLDEINIASLSDLLRCELKNRQILISSHEDEISAYMRYRFARAGLSQKAIHVQNHLSVAQTSYQ